MTLTPEEADALDEAMREQVAKEAAERDAAPPLKPTEVPFRQALAFIDCVIGVRGEDDAFHPRSPEAYAHVEAVLSAIVPPTAWEMPSVYDMRHGYWHDPDIAFLAYLKGVVVTLEQQLRETGALNHALPR